MLHEEGGLIGLNEYPMWRQERMEMMYVRWVLRQGITQHDRGARCGVMAVSCAGE